VKKLRGTIAVAAVLALAVGATPASAGNDKSTVAVTVSSTTTVPLVLPGFFRGR
jgi:hypothetical protein